jgi:hypothetical protein
MIVVTLDVTRKGVQNPLNVQKLLKNVEKAINFIYKSTCLFYHIKITLCSSFNKRSPSILYHIFYPKRNSIGLYKKNFFILSNNIVPYV